MTLDLSSPQFGLANPATDEIQISISTAGDLNGDGFDDLLIGLPDLYTDDGGLLIIYGRPEGSGVLLGNVATAAGQSLIGSAGSDVMTDFNGTIQANIAFNGGSGNDIINLYGPGSRAIDGGAGMDSLNLLSGGNIDLRGLNENLSGIEKISLGTTAQQLTIGIDQIFHLLQESADRTLTFDTSQTGTSVRIDNNGDSATSLSGLDFTAGATSGGYQAWGFGGYTLYVDIDTTVTVANV